MNGILRLAVVTPGLTLFNLAAQTPPTLEVDLHAVLTIRGTVGTVYSIEYVTDLAQTNDPSAWRCAEYLQLPASPYLWTDESAPATGKRFYRAKVMEPPTNMVFIPPGTFRMGSPTNEVDHETWEGPQTVAIIRRGFWVGKYEVTQGEYLEVMGNNPSWFNGVGEWTSFDPDCLCLVVTNRYYGTELNRPVENVSWQDATDYCVRLTERDRRMGRIAVNSVYRLPTEAEWEYACRAWTSTRLSYGDDPGYTNLTDHAWYYVNSDWMTHRVGQKLPNPWGLYDMAGNVWEWCQDWYGIGYPGGIVVDPRGPRESPIPGRVLRGDGWWGGRTALMDHAEWCRSAARLCDVPDDRDYDIGFRAVLAPGQ